MHPHGDEVVVCLTGAVMLIQELGDGTLARAAMSRVAAGMTPAAHGHDAMPEIPCQSGAWPTMQWVSSRQRSAGDALS